MELRCDVCKSVTSVTWSFLIDEEGYRLERDPRSLARAPELVVGFYRDYYDRNYDYKFLCFCGPACTESELARAAILRGFSKLGYGVNVFDRSLLEADADDEEAQDLLRVSVYTDSDSLVDVLDRFGLEIHKKEGGLAHYDSDSDSIS